MKRVNRKILLLFMVACLVLGMIPLTAAANSFTWSGAQPTVMDGDTVTITATAAGTLNVPANATVTIIGDVAANAPEVGLNIGAGATVKWAATYTGSRTALVTVNGNGTLDVVTGGSIQNTGTQYAIMIMGAPSTTVTVSGGTVSATSGYAIIANGGNCKVTVSGGEVTATTGNAVYLYGANASVTVSGGKVSTTTGNAISANGANNTVSVSGGEVSNSATTLLGAVIRMSSASNTGLNVTVSGTGKVTGSYAVYSNGSVNIDGGEITTSTGYAIHINANVNSTVTVRGGSVKATGTGGYAIYTPGNVEVTGGEVTTTTSPAIFAHGAASAVSVSGGVVSNSATTLGSSAINMFNASNTGLNVTVSGTGKVNALGAGGSAVYTHGNVSVTGGEVTATTGNAIFAAGASSTVTVSGGEVSNSAINSVCPVICMNNDANIGTNVTVSGTGNVKATGNRGDAISTSGSVLIEGGEVSATTGRAIYTPTSPNYSFGSGPTVTVSGGKVSVTSGNVYYSNTHYSTLNVSGGQVTATTGCVFDTSCDGPAMTVSGGFVFAYGYDIMGPGNVICINEMPIINAPGAVAAWDQSAAGATPTYNAGDTTDIIKLPPAASAVWGLVGGQGGILYTNGANTGFFPLPVTVIGAGDTTPPILSNGNVNRTSDTAATIGFTTDEAGTAYYLVKNQGDAAPTGADVKAGTLIGTVSGVESNLAVVLTSGAKDIYVVVVDAAGNISAPLKIEAAAYAAPTYTATINPTSKTFTGAMESYGAQTAQVFTIENTGTAQITGLTASLGGSAFEISTALSDTSVNSGGTVTVSVSPKTGLAAGTYNDTLTITGSNGVTLTASLSFTVSAAPAAPNITGPTSMTLTAGYAVTSTTAYTVTGNPAPTVSASGNPAITWNNATQTLDIAAGLAAGTYPVVLTASNGVGLDATLTFTLTVSAASAAPNITGPTSMTLTAGYAATSTTAYTVTGNPAPTVSASGNPAITWNNATQTLDIAAGLAAGTYPVVLTAANGVAPDATLTFTLTVSAASAASANVGNVTISGTVGSALGGGQRATITLTGDTVAGNLVNADASGWFTGLPAGITVTANASVGDSTITLTFGGTPTAASTAQFNINIPGNILIGGSAVAVATNPNAKFHITRTPKPPSPLPKTGDGFPLAGLLALLGVGLIAMAYLGARLRKRE